MATCMFSPATRGSTIWSPQSNYSRQPNVLEPYSVSTGPEGLTEQIVEIRLSVQKSVPAVSAMGNLGLTLSEWQRGSWKSLQN